MSNDNTSNWPELASALYDKLTDRNAELTYDFDQLQIQVPNSAGDQVNHAAWTINGSISIRSKNLE
ncbi:hypothetical protein [Ferrimonas senticii]|uniref:hypothetical protein n=1 Tax=Ferrimonas senticii TaxID=394566 RepID=UPI0004124643|nr:hypothetical protein [Ferrimonas senticii]